MGCESDRPIDRASHTNHYKFPPVGQGRAEQSKAEQGRRGRVRTGRSRAVQGRGAQGAAVQIRTVKDRAKQKQSKTAEPSRAMQGIVDHDMAGQNRL